MNTHTHTHTHTQTTVGQFTTEPNIASTTPVVGSTEATGSTGAATTAGPQPCWAISDSESCIGQCQWNSDFFFCDDATTTPGVNTGTTAPMGSTTAGGIVCWMIMDSGSCTGQCQWNSDFSFCEDITTTPGATSQQVDMSTTGDQYGTSQTGGATTVGQTECWMAMDSVECVDPCVWNADFGFCDNSPDTTTQGKWMI